MLNDRIPSPTSVHPLQVKTVEIDGRGDIWSVACLDDHILGGGKEGTIRCWRMEDGKEEGTLMDAGSPIGSIAVSQDGKWIVGGTMSGLVMVWNTESRKKVVEFKPHRDWVRAVDVSPDGRRIATGSYDSTACIWSLSTGQRLIRPLKHDAAVVAVKFSGSNGSFVATATLGCFSIRIYDSEKGQLIADVPIKVNSSLNQSLAWVSDSKELFALSHDGTINCLDVSSGITRSHWRIHSNDLPTCIVPASDGTFIVASANSWVSFWDTTTHQQIGLIQDKEFVNSMTISPNHCLATAGGKKITLRSICDILPSHSRDDVSALHQILSARDDSLIAIRFVDCSSPFLCRKSRTRRLKMLLTRRPMNNSNHMIAHLRSMAPFKTKQ